MKTIASTALAAALVLPATTALAAPVAYTLDSSHSQVIFDYEHLGFSTTYGLFSGFEGDIMFDAEEPANSSVDVSIPTRSMLTGWEARFEHFMSDDFFGADEDDMVTFTSTEINVTGENTAEITGELTMNDITQVVTLDTTLNQAGEHPMEGKPWLGFDATTTVLRSDFGMDMFTPFVSDEVNVVISLEAMQAE
ncbi:MAG: YceI family protein [Loktanella sp.]|nr:YceI family protein [Loktanella sp.]